MNYVSLDGLNDAKKKINYLMQMKYNDPTTEYNETTDTQADEMFQKVISAVKSGGEMLFQLITFVAREKVTKTRVIGQEPVEYEIPQYTSTGKPKMNKGRFVYNTETVMEDIKEDYVEAGLPYYRSTNVYINFHQVLLKLVNLLKSTNVSLQNLINNIGYVEPENMSLFKESMSDFRTAYQQYNEFMRSDDSLAIKKHSESNTPEADNLKRNNELMNKEVVKLYEFDKKIDASYNYRSTNVQLKRSPIDMVENIKSNNDAVNDVVDESDDEF